MLSNEKGFTLLEIIVALTILATAILALVSMFSGGLNLASQSDRYLNGVFLAQQKFSQLELEDFKSEALEGVFENQDVYRWQLEVLPYDSALNNEDARINIQKISLRVFWEDKGLEKEVRLISLKTRGETHTASVGQLDSSSQTTSTTPKAPEAPKIKNLNPSAIP